MLNLDEYGKTVIEYALDFKNFAFLKYLIENKYLWFVDAVNDPNDFFRRYSPNFGIGTNIERRLPPEHLESRWHISYRKDESGSDRWMPHQRDALQCELAGNDNLRMRMIALAVEHNDIELLDLLRAREIPSLYQACYIVYRTPECDRYYDECMVKCIAEGSEEVLDYFAEEFEICAIVLLLLAVTATILTMQYQQKKAVEKYAKNLDLAMSAMLSGADAAGNC